MGNLDIRRKTVKRKKASVSGGCEWTRLNSGFSCDDRMERQVQTNICHKFGLSHQPLSCEALVKYLDVHKSKSCAVVGQQHL